MLSSSVCFGQSNDPFFTETILDSWTDPDGAPQGNTSNYGSPFEAADAATSAEMLARLFLIADPREVQEILMLNPWSVPSIQAVLEEL